MKKPARIVMWAVIVKSMRTEWIYYPSIARTRKQSFELYKAIHQPWIAISDLQNKRVRLAKVTVEEVTA